MERSNSRHHPLCPDCGYDLLGSVDARRRVCPECGYEFTLDELSRRGRTGDWTPAHGYRRAVTVLLVKSLVSLPVCTALLWLWSRPHWRHRHTGGSSSCWQLPVSCSVSCCV